MASLKLLYDRADARIADAMARHGVFTLRMSVGLVFLWFGLLKFFPGLSPAQDIAARTMDVVTLGAVPPGMAMLVLAVWETAIGVGLIVGVFMRLTLLLLFIQMFGTLTPLFLFPGEVFARVPYAPTLEGQYIVKNLVLISAGIVLGATVRGGGIEADPSRIERDKA